jgi:hypothetical protein
MQIQPDGGCKGYCVSQGGKLFFQILFFAFSPISTKRRRRSVREFVVDPIVSEDRGPF